MSGLILLEMDSVCIRFSFTRNGFSVCYRFSFPRNGFSVLGLVFLEMDSVCHV